LIPLPPHHFVRLSIKTVEPATNQEAAGSSPAGRTIPTFRWNGYALQHSGTPRCVARNASGHESSDHRLPRRGWLRCRLQSVPARSRREHERVLLPCRLLALCVWRSRFASARTDSHLLTAEPTLFRHDEGDERRASFQMRPSDARTQSFCSDTATRPTPANLAFTNNGCHCVIWNIAEMLIPVTLSHA
jgi:hypothetical protein